MREIRFRGLNGFGIWFYGNHVYCHFSECNYIVKENSCRTYDSFDVIQKTIGQYTGLKDNNGFEIYEGDKLQRNSQWICSIGWDVDLACFVTYNSNGRYSGSLSDLDLSDWEVIGNIHEGEKNES